MIFSYFEAVTPRQRAKPLIGAPDWEFAFGTGLSRGFRFGTVSVRLAVGYDAAEDKLKPGEYAVEYLRRLSPLARLYLGLEADEDEVEPQLRLTRGLTLELNNAFGITSKATDWAPEIGLLFSFPR
jgi:hypothetical protein